MRKPVAAKECRGLMFSSVLTLVLFSFYFVFSFSARFYRSTIISVYPSGINNSERTDGLQMRE